MLRSVSRLPPIHGFCTTAPLYSSSPLHPALLVKAPRGQLPKPQSGMPARYESSNVHVPACGSSPPPLIERGSPALAPNRYRPDRAHMDDTLRHNRARVDLVPVAG